jgi:hypothetical protein
MTNGERIDGGEGQRQRFVTNRVLIVLAVAAILVGNLPAASQYVPASPMMQTLSDLFFAQWRIVLRNAILL